MWARGALDETCTSSLAAREFLQNDFGVLRSPSYIRSSSDHTAQRKWIKTAGTQRIVYPYRNVASKTFGVNGTYQTKYKKTLYYLRLLDATRLLFPGRLLPPAGRPPFGPDPPLLPGTESKLSVEALVFCFDLRPWPPNPNF